MCSNVIKYNDVEFACRKCNECIGAKFSDWVARTVADSNHFKNMMVLMLSYNDETQASRDGSVAFNYNHVKLFLKRIRRQIETKTKKTGTVRFICAGEMGSKKGRVHWHVVLLTDEDLSEYGNWCDYITKEEITEKQEKFETNIQWSLWEHGFVHLQKADAGGVAYCMKYAIKDQFNVRKSEGTMRHHKAENHASSLFRMSKNPPIGMIWMENKVARLRKKGSVLTKLELKVENYNGYWRPVGLLRTYLIDQMREINNEVYASTGRIAPQMNTLVSTLVDQEKDLERLLYGPIQEIDEDYEDGTFKRRQELASKEIADTHQRSSTKQQCGGFYPCSWCQRGFTDQETEDFSRWAHTYFTEEENIKCEDYDYAFRRRREVNPFCKSKHTSKVQRAFFSYTR